MKQSLILALIASSFAIAACGNKTEPATPGTVAKPAATAPAGAAAPTGKKPEDQPRQATYDPNLKPAQIVWDSPEKQKAWEARQAELKKTPAPKK